MSDPWYAELLGYNRRFSQSAPYRNNHAGKPKRARAAATAVAGHVKVARLKRAHWASVRTLPAP